MIFHSFLLYLSMKRTSCYRCGYLKKGHTKNGKTYYYCEDRDCTVDPDEPECNYN